MAVHQTAYVVDASRVVHETIGDETILIDLADGAYYSLTGTGPEIWALLSAGTSEDEAALVMRARYPESSDEAEQGVSELAGRLVEEGLLERESAGAGSDPREAVLPPASQVFAAPVLARYTDMQYFLQLDPIHQVDETAGWPAPHPGGADG